MHKQHPQTAYRKYAILIGTIFENCDKSSTIREAVKLLSSKGIVEGQQADEEAAPAHDPNQKTARPRSDMLQGLAVIFYGKKSCFPGRCGTYFLSTGSAVITMTRTVTSLPLSLSSILQSAVPM